MVQGASNLSKHNRLIANDTLEILEKGSYLYEGRTVDISLALENAVERTIQLMPEDSAGAFRNTGVFPTKIEVVNETSLEGARALLDAEEPPGSVCVLNFASAKNPGGGFLKGADAQEESLARVSGLYVCLKDQEMYAHHRMLNDAIYTNRMIYSPDVPVFRDDEGSLLAQPYLVSFVTAPAANTKALSRRFGFDEGAVEAVMRERIVRVLGLMHEMGHEAIVLGAWGCGVFANPPRTIARLFGQALTTKFFGCFSRIRFSILDRPDGSTISEFAQLQTG